jgi:hypothetical protein
MVAESRNDPNRAIHDQVASHRALARVELHDLLNDAARRRPRALLGVLEYWMAPQPAESKSRVHD